MMRYVRMYLPTGKVEVKITSAENLSGFFYILLHEATHIIDYVNRYTPYVGPNMLELQGRSSRETPFTDQLATVSSKTAIIMIFPDISLISQYFINVYVVLREDDK